MKKLFLTSGLAIMMAGSAFAATDIGYTQPNPPTVTGGYDAASCQEPTLGIFSGDQTFYAKWTTNVSGAITLDSNRYTSDDANAVAASTASTTATPTPLYSVYDVGMYSDASHAAARDSSTIPGITTAPQMTGYDFTGFYTTKSSENAADKVINADKSFTSGAKNKISATGGTATWYAHWSPHTLNLTYTCGTTPSVTTLGVSSSGSASSLNTTATYDASKTLATTPGTCALENDRGGFHFGGWTCDYDLEDGTNTNTSYASSFANNAWTVSKTINAWKADHAVECQAIWTGNDYTISYNHGTAGSRTEGFSGSMSNQNVVFGTDSVTLTANAFSIPGYTFAGWHGDYDRTTGNASTDSNGNYTDQYEFTQYDIGHNLALTAQWTADSYRVRYQQGAHGVIASGASTTEVSTGVYAYDHSANTQTSLTYDAIYTPLTPAAVGLTPDTGYTFAGWKRDGTETVLSAGQAMSSAWTETNGMNVTAQWTANGHRITYTCGDQPGSQALTSGTAAPAYADVTFADNYQLPTNAGTCEYKGWHFSGWDCNYALSTTTAASETPSSTYGNLYAATFNAQGEVTGITNGSGVFRVDNNVTCKATWARNQIGTTWVPGAGADQQTTSNSCQYDQGITIPDAPTKTGYTFQGWTIVNPNPAQGG